MGKSFDPDYYEPIRDSRVREGLQLIAQQTEEDFQNLISVLQQFSVNVIRVDPGYRNIEIDISNNIDFGSVPMSPMMPRNSAIVLGNKLLITEKGNPAYDSIWYKTVQHDYIINPWSKHTNPNLGTWELDVYHQFHAPFVTRVGDTIFVDKRDHPWLPEFFTKNLSDYRVITVDIGGHNDGSFSPIKPGKIISVFGETHYKDTFPGWEVFFVRQEKWYHLQQWNDLKTRTQGRWFIGNDHGIDVNDVLIEFVDTWLTKWVGYVAETVFDVNCLVIDQHHVCFTHHNQNLWAWCEKNAITPILVPFRHRFFWDGGLHCMTLDLIREGQPFSFASCV